MEDLIESSNREYKIGQDNLKQEYKRMVQYIRNMEDKQ